MLVFIWTALVYLAFSFVAAYSILTVRDFFRRWYQEGPEFFLVKMFKYVDIFRDGTTDIYLRRFYIYPRTGPTEDNKLVPRLYLHKFYRGDEDPHMHDHPWPFTSLILTKGYWEETPWDAKDDKDWEIGETRYPSWGPDEGDWRERKFYPALSILRRPATWKHRVILEKGGQAWTLVKTGVKERSWGFWVKDTLCPWRQYNDGVCYCTPEEKVAATNDPNHEASS